MRTKIKERILNAALSRCLQKNQNANPTAKSDLKNFIDKGVNSMSDLECESEPFILIAESNVLRLIDQMSGECKDRNITNDLDSISLNNVKEHICPLWPFC